MQLRHLSTLTDAADGAAKVTALAWSPNGVKLAACTVDRVVMLFDEHGEKQDKFATKPAESGGAKTYLVTGMAWSPDSNKLAVAQSDNIVFVYKLGQGDATVWDKKKSICNKFIQSSPVTCITWPHAHHHTIVLGTVEGKVRVGNLRTNKSQSIYPTGSMCVALATSPDGDGIVSAHMDGSIYRYQLSEGGRHGLVAKHSCPAYALSWAESILAAGADKRLVVYGLDGRIQQQFDHSNEPGEREPAVALASPSGQSVLVGSYSRLRVYTYNVRRTTWEAAAPKDVPNLYTVTALAWRPDGSRVHVGTLCGAIEGFDCAFRRTRYKDKFEFVYVGPSQVIVTKLSDNMRIVLRSHYNYEIEKVHVLGDDQYIVGYTSDTLLLGDLVSCQLSEVAWQPTGSERFYFENPACCLIFNAGELAVVQYGVNEVLGSVRTEYMSPHLLSVCVQPRSKRLAEDDTVENLKKLAYLVDLKTISVIALGSGVELVHLEHDAKVDWLELNENGGKLLFRDKRRRLVLYDIATESKTTLLTYCSYVQWVPSSDVIVAQNRNNLCVWYSVDHLDRMTTFQIKGDVEDIERTNGATEVLVDEGVNMVTYTLDESLIEFGTAVEDEDYARAVNFLEAQIDAPETQAMWSTLAQLAMEAEDLPVAARCYSALGNISKARYLQQMIRDQANGDESARAKMAALNKHFKLAETIYLEQGQVDAAINMYQSLHKWDEAIAVAAARNHPELDAMRSKYTAWLLESGQEEKAGELREQEGDLQGALNFYMKAGLPGRAAHLVMAQPDLYGRTDVVERVASALMQASIYDRAGELLERAQMPQRALEAYKKGHAYARAVELCRQSFPNEVIVLEEAWGDHLVRQKQMDAAIPHFIEAGRSEKAIEAAIAARQWAKAAQVVDMQDDALARPYFIQLARHYASVRDFRNAEKYFIKGQAPRGAVDMYVAAGQWDKAHKISSRFMSQDEVSQSYLVKAEELETQHKYAEAEKLYVTVNEPDLAINMYKKIKQYEDMLRLVKTYHPDLMEQTHIHLAQELEDESSHTQAEQHYISGNDWKSAVNMYRARDMWEDAYRVAKTHGGLPASQQVGYLWARSLGGDSAIKLLQKLGIVDVAVDFACEQNMFDFAFEIARAAATHRTKDIHLKKAMFLEDEGRSKEAEEHFVLADKPKEAVLMYVHAQDWDAAQRVAEAHDPESISDVLVGQARVAFQNKDYARAEALLLRANRPELAVRYYREAQMWDDCLRLAGEYLPHMLPGLRRDYELATGNSVPDGKGPAGASMSPNGNEPPSHGGRATSEALLVQARQYASAGQHGKAVELYLRLQPGDMNAAQLQEAYEQAAELAAKFLPSQAAEITTQLCQRLVQMNRHSVAADFFAGLDMFTEACIVCVQGRDFEQAQRFAEAAADPELVQKVKQAYVAHLEQQNDGSGLAGVDAMAALDLYVRNEQWQECMREAAQHGGQVLNKYAALYAARLLQQGDPVAALGVFREHGAPPTPANHNIYRRLLHDMLAERGQAQEYKTWAALRDVLASVRSGVAVQQPQSEPEFERMTTIAHYMALSAATRGIEDLKDLHSKLCIALLRYTDIVPVDRAFYEAGIACRANGAESMAFVFLNRYLDLSEAIDDGSLDSLDNTDFLNAGIPLEVPLPDRQFVEEDEHKEAKQWVLAISMDHDVDLQLETDERGLFVGSLQMPSGGQEYPACVACGLAVFEEAVNFGRGKAARKGEWSQFLMAMKTTKSPQLEDVMRFLSSWCNASASMSYSFT